MIQTHQSITTIWFKEFRQHSLKLVALRRPLLRLRVQIIRLSENRGPLRFDVKVCSAASLAILRWRVGVRYEATPAACLVFISRADCHALFGFKRAL